MCQHCDYLFLETEVLDFPEPYLRIIEEDDGFDQSIHKKGCRPSMKFIEGILEINNFDYKCIMDPILNTRYHKYDWKDEHNHNNMIGRRRFWICWRKNKPHPFREGIHS